MSSRTRRSKPSPTLSAVGSPFSGPTSRKRAASVSTVSSSKSEEVQSLPASKRFKKAVPGSPEYASQASVVTTSKQSRNVVARRLSFGSIGYVSDADNNIDDNPVAEETSKPSEKRQRRMSEKVLYMSASASTKKKTLANKASPSPDFDSLEKTEPIDSSSLLNSATKNKGKKITTIAIEISSDEEEIATPKAKGTSANRKTVSKKRTPANKPSPSPEIDYLEKKIEASDEEEIATPTPKAKGTSANRKIVSKKRTPANKPSPSPEIDYLEKKIKAEPLDSGILLDSTPKNKGKKKMTAVLSDEEEIATPISKAKNTLANRKTASPSKTKLPVSGSDREDQGELAGREKSPSNKSTESDGTKQDYPSPHSLANPLVIVPAKDDLRAEYCPSVLLVDGCPMELGSGAFEFFDEKVIRNLKSAVSFKQLEPFANISSLVVGNVSVENFRHDVLWANSKKPVVFTMLASVHSCNLVQPIQLKNYKIKALSVVPYGESWNQFAVLLGGLYGAGEMQGPFEYGCLLKLTSRREGGYSGTSSVPSTPVATPKKNLKAFASSRAKASTVWFDRKQPSCLNFTDDIPIYDASNDSFLFKRDDFNTMQNLPRYRKYGVRTPSDLPHQSLVSVFFTLNTYPKDYNSSAPSQFGTGGADGNSSAAPIPTNQNSVLSFNLHSVVYYGVIPED